MFEPRSDINATALKIEIDRLFDSMADETDKTSDAYKTKSKRLRELYNLRKLDSEVETARRRVPSPDAILAAVASVAGIVLIVGYEQKGVITSQAMKLIRLVK